MEKSMSDYFGDENDYWSCQHHNSGTDYLKESNEFIYRKKLGTDAEHSALSRAFLDEAFSARCHQQYGHLLCKLKSVWFHTERAARLECLFCYDKFRKDALDIVAFFEEELKKCKDGNPTTFQIYQRSYLSTLISLMPTIIHLVLELLRSVHALWKDDTMVTLPEVLAEEIRKLKLQDTDLSEFKENDIAHWLQLIRERGYNLLGLCAAIEGPFCELLDSSSVSDAIIEDLGCMESRHVSKLIDLVIIPLMKYCPSKRLGEWILKLLPPLFIYCEDILCGAWFNLLNKGRAGYPYYFGYLRGSQRSAKKLEECLLLDLTRKVSKLLGVLASSKPIGALTCVDLQSVSTAKAASSRDSKCASSNSVIGYTLHNDCFGMLNMNLFGSWVDGEATRDAVPFCRALVQVAVATQNSKLRRFILHDMLPATIKRLCTDLPCAVQRTIKKLSCQLNSSKSQKASKDLWILCQEIYAVHIQNQDFTAENPGNVNRRGQFKDWLARQKKELFAKASYDIPVGFPSDLWNWEFEDEFQRYLPTYIDILYEVDAMDCPEYGCSRSSTLLEKLRPEFRLKHGINSFRDRHMWTINDMIKRKLPAEYSKRRSRQMDKWLCKLISSKPYFKHSDERQSAMTWLMEDSPLDANLSELDVQDAVDIFYNTILFYLEPQFHPLIREGQKDFLIKVAHQFVFAEETNSCKPLEPESRDFPGHLQPYASSYIHTMKLQSKDKSVLQFVEKNNVKSRFGNLDDKLIKLSLEDRAQIVDTIRQVDIYSENLKNITADDKLKVCLQNLVHELKEEGFFNVDNDSIDWEKTCFVSLIDEFKELVFKGHGCPRYVAIQGIMEYWIISQRSDINGQVAFEKVIEGVCHTWKKNIAELWMDTRYYEESCYDLLRNPLKKILPK
ncbi:uncharacterized protein LOC119308337 isoform X2 [Triticum dicoccoides]|nr:uncharacterized protein LOC119308337 isoform X2 [Triticum dicoccoides]